MADTETQRSFTESEPKVESSFNGSVSDTPRTDAVAETLTYGRNSPFAEQMTRLARELEREVEQWKQHFLAFAIVHAGQYGKEGCLHFTHYDLLKEAGARMVDFTRCGDSQNAKSAGTDASEKTSRCPAASIILRKTHP